MTRSDPTAPVTPRTEAGRRLAARAKREAWGNWEGIAQFEIPAIEREAGSTDALRAAILRFCDLPATLTVENLPTFVGQISAALAASDAGPAGIDVDGLRPFLLHRVQLAIVNGLDEYARLSRESDR
jgi:hypothetical protein